MITRVETFFRKLRRMMSRSEWSYRMLGLQPVSGRATAPGLIMIQVDGLSHTQLQRALANGNMPFLRRLLKRQHYTLHRFYSGLPSSTPSIQGELFYGVKQSVPAFSYMDRESKKMHRMYEPTASAAVQQDLEQLGQGLLAGGSAYCNIFTGGAAESHFCPASLGWGEVLRSANPWIMGLFLITNAYSLFRILLLLFVEMLLAAWDCLGGLAKGNNFFKELKFVPTRVAICILLRELITIGVKMDISRGLPIIHLNLIGYDEQAHRRGPSSLFAHWALKGIDDAVSRIWRATKRATRREYDIWIYSDHGQEATAPYINFTGQNIQDTVQSILAEMKRAPDVRPERAEGIQSQRVTFLGGKKFQRLLGKYTGDRNAQSITAPVICAMGPLGMIYLPEELEEKQHRNLARLLVSRALVPMVLMKDGKNMVKAWTEHGEYTLPDQGEELLGHYHPFLDEVSNDLTALCHHPKAGDLLICGWRKSGYSLSFSIENGAHGGPGPQETMGFALLPTDAPVTKSKSFSMVPMELRYAAQRFLGRIKQPPRRPVIRRDKTTTLRVMTYNVHSCIGLDGKMSPERIARVIARHKPDVVALQELDVGKARTGNIDQAHRIAEALRMAYHFHPTMQVAEELYGDAILSHLPLQVIKTGKLPGLKHKPNLEPRGAIWVSVKVGDRQVQCINTHLGLRSKERWQQVTALLGEEWLNHPDCRRPVVLLGDFNALPSSPVCLRIRDILHDVQITAKKHRPRATFGGRYQLARIDHIFVDPGTEITGIEIPDWDLARVASDHFPLIAEIEIPV